MKPKPELLKCPGCDKSYDNYKDYFASWTSHLKEGVDEGRAFAPVDHDEAVRYYQQYPSAIERGLKILTSEVSAFRGRVDLIGVDRELNICLIDVTTGHDWKRKVQQLRRYKDSIEWIGKHVFGVSFPGRIRVLVVKPNDYVRDVTDLVL